MIGYSLLTLLPLLSYAYSADLFTRIEPTCSSGVTTPSSTTPSTGSAELEAPSLVSCISVCQSKGNCSGVTFKSGRCSLYANDTMPDDSSCVQFYKKVMSRWTPYGSRRYLPLPFQDAIDWDAARALCQKEAEGSDLAAIPPTEEEDLVNFLKEITENAAGEWWLGPRKLANSASWLNPDATPSRNGAGLSWLGVSEGEYPRYLALSSTTGLWKIQHGNKLSSAVCEAPLADG